MGWKKINLDHSNSQKTEKNNQRTPWIFNFFNDNQSKETLPNQKVFTHEA